MTQRMRAWQGMRRSPGGDLILEVENTRRLILASYIAFSFLFLFYFTSFILLLFSLALHPLLSQFHPQGKFLKHELRD